MFKSILEQNPYIDKIHSFDKDIKEIYEELAKEKFDCIIDLHNNLRSFRLKRHLGVKSYSFNKLNLLKLTAVITKRVKVLPEKHIVQRYLETLEPLGLKDDGKGLDYFIPEHAKTLPNALELPTQFITLVLGGSYFTKKIPLNKLREICRSAKLPLVLVGGKDGVDEAASLEKEFKGLINLCGTLSLHQSAYVISEAAWVITSDTGMMHIAAAFNKKTISVWGNTVPEFGMGPYLPPKENKILEIKGLSCRPCSKLGYHKCPKGHFKCMNQIDYSFLETLQ